MPALRFLFWPVVWIVQAPMLAAYLITLVDHPAYQLVTLLVAVALLGSWAWRWDRQVQLPASIWSSSLVLAGLTVAAVGALTESVWLAGVSGLLTLASFFCSQKERGADRTFAYLTGLSLAILRPPMGVFQHFSGWTAETIRSTVVSILRWLEVPHVAFDEALLLPSNRVYWDDQLVGPLGWPVFVGVALLHSALWRRRWPIQLGNIVLGWGTCVLYHICTTVGQAYIVASGLAIEPGIITFLSIPLAYLFFLSAERGLRGLLAPIPDGPEDARQENLVVYAWNWWLHGIRLQFSKGKRSTPDSTRSAKAVPRWFGAAVLVAAVVVGVFEVAKLPKVIATTRSVTSPTEWLPRSNLVEPIWGDRSEAVDVRHLVAPLDRRWGQEAMVWTAYFPNRVTEIGVTLRPAQWFGLPTLYASDGWTLVDVERRTNPAADSITVPPFVTMQANRNNETSLLCFAGYVPQTTTITVDPPQGACHMIQSFTRFNRAPSPEVIETVMAEFAAVLSNLSSEHLHEDAPQGE